MPDGSQWLASGTLYSKNMLISGKNRAVASTYFKADATAPMTHLVCYNYLQEQSFIRIETGKGTDMADELSLYRFWLEKLPADDPLHAELLAVEGNEKSFRYFV